MTGNLRHPLHSTSLHHPVRRFARATLDCCTQCNTRLLHAMQHSIVARNATLDCCTQCNTRLLHAMQHSIIARNATLDYCTQCNTRLLHAMQHSIIARNATLDCCTQQSFVARNSHLLHATIICCAQQLFVARNSNLLRAIQKYCRLLSQLLVQVNLPLHFPHHKTAARFS